MKQRALWLILLLLASLPVFGQQTGISGTVMDLNGAALPGATVRMEQVGGGGSLSTSANGQGLYNFQSVRAADYTVKVTMDGFAPMEKKVTLLVGQDISIDFNLPVASANSSVEVSSQEIAISTTTSEVAGNIDPVQMKEVPLNGRNWMELALLIPGISKNDVDGNSPAIGADGGKFQINLDGQQTTQDLASSGFGQPRYSRDALSQFQIITNRFDATLGRSAEMQINAQTKSGTDSIHGTAYGYFRSDAMNASDFVAKSVLPYSDQQYGGTVGGPVLKTRLWYFGGFEGERSPQTYFMTPNYFNGQSFTLNSTTKIYTMLERLDFQQSDKSRFFLRVAGFTNTNPVSGLSGTSHPSRGYSSAQKSISTIGDWSYNLSSNKVNDLHLGFSYFNYSNRPLLSSPEFRFATTVGAPYNYPGLRFQNAWSARDDFYWTKGRHSIKLGGEYINTWAHGIFQQNFGGTISAVKSTPTRLDLLFPVWNDPTTWNYTALSPYVSTYVQGFGDTGLSIYRSSVGFWFQDDWKVLPRLTLNLGIRYDNDLGMMNSSIVLKSGLLTPHTSDNNNFAPRVGFAYDLLGNHKTVIRGGAGIYYADVEANQYYDQQLFNGQTTVQASVNAGSGTIDLNKPFGSKTGADFLNGAATVAQALQLVQPGVIVPWGAQGTIGIAQQLSARWTLQADYVHYRIHSEWIRFDQNQQLNSNTGYARTSGSSLAVADSRFTTILRFDTPRTSGAIYDGLLIDLRRAFSNGFTIAAGYTLARSKSSSEGAFYVPNNQFNYGDEWGPSSGNQTSTFNVNGLYKLPWGFQTAGLFRYGSGAAYAVTAGSSPFFNSPSSNRTYLATAKVYNSAADNYASPAPGYNLVKRDSFYGRPIYRLDARLQKSFSFASDRFHVIPIAEAFNLLNHPNYGSYNTNILLATYGQPAQNTSLSYGPRQIQLAVRFEF